VSGEDATPKATENAKANAFALDDFLSDLADLCVDLYLEEVASEEEPAPQPTTKQEPDR
jgi:hypothetical protein